MNTLSRAGLTLVTGACFALVASPAAAHPDDHGHHGDRGYEVVEVGEWTPVAPEFYAPFEVAACGDVITLGTGDVREVEERVSTLENGATLIEIRGGFTVDLTRQSDGAMIDELDVSGPGRTLISADGTQVRDTLFGPSILAPMSEDDAHEFMEAFGTDLVYFADPEQSVTFSLTVDPEAGEVVELRSIDVDAHVVDACGWFDDHHHDGNHHHHDGNHHDGDGHHDGDRKHHYHHGD